MREKRTLWTGESRRSFIKRGALTSGGLAVGLSSIGRVTAQEGDTTETSAGDDSDSRSAVMFNDAYRPGAQFRVVSPPISERPDLEDRPEGKSLEGYTTRVIEYVNTAEEVLLLVPPDVDVKQGSVYELARVFSAFENTPSRGLVSVQFEPVAAEDVLFDDDDGNPGREPGQDFDVVKGGGQALITAYRFYPGALFRITSGVIEWVPREKVQRTGASGNYNTRLAEYLGTEMSFVLYPARSAQIERGAVYVMRRESEPVDAEGRLRLVSFSRVDESDLNQDLLGG